MITPSDSPSSPSNYAEVTPHGQGTAPYDIQAPQADLTAAVDAANALGGAGFLYPMGPRQAETAALMNSPAGYAEQDITAGWNAGGEWPGDPYPGSG